METKSTYAKKLLDPRWQKKRLEIFNRDKFCCLMCSCDTDTLHVHHERYCKDPWDVENEDLKTLCFRCHEVAEICKKEDIKFTNINKLDYGDDSFVYMVNHPLQDGRNTVSVIHNKNGSKFEFAGFKLTKEFVELMLKTF